MRARHLLHTTCKARLSKTQMVCDVSGTKRRWVPITDNSHIKPRTRQAQITLHVRCGRFVHIIVEHNFYN